MDELQIVKSKTCGTWAAANRPGREAGSNRKTMNKKECSEVNRFTADEMLKLVMILSLTLEDFNAIFFNQDLPFG